MQMSYQNLLDNAIAAPDFFDNPYPAYADLRLHDPVHWSETWNAWVVTRYDDVNAFLRRPDDFSNANRQQRLLDRLPSDSRDELGPLHEHYAHGGLINTDPPEHTRLRKLVNKAFTPRVVSQMRPRIEKLVDDLIDAVVPNGSMDIIRDFAYPLPAIVIANMLGVPAEERDLFKTWSEQITVFLGVGHPDVDHARQSQQSIVEMKTYLGDLLVQRRAAPKDDLLTHLAFAREDQDLLNDSELLATCVTLLIAGHETTTNLIGNGLLALLRHPDQQRQLTAKPDLIEPAIEEMLRYDSPVHSVKRIIQHDITLGDKQLRTGELMYLMIGSANRDAAHFEESERFNIRRNPDANRHIAFGFGIHYCLGAPLARLESAVAITTLLRRLKNIRLSEPAEFKRNMSVRGLQDLPVVFSA